MKVHIVAVHCLASKRGKRGAVEVEVQTGGAAARPEEPIIVLESDDEKPDEQEQADAGAVE